MNSNTGHRHTAEEWQNSRLPSFPRVIRNHSNESNPHILVDGIDEMQLTARELKLGVSDECPLEGHVTNNGGQFPLFGDIQGRIY